MDGDKNEQKTQGVELKGGHEPAKIVGGRRIVTRDRHSESEDKAPPKKSEQTEEEKEEFGEDKPVKQSSVVISGAKASDELSFPKEAVKAYHDKPMPTHDKSSAAHSKPKIIQQPKK